VESLFLTKFPEVQGAKDQDREDCQSCEIMVRQGKSDAKSGSSNRCAFLFLVEIDEKPQRCNDQKGKTCA